MKNYSFLFTIIIFFSLITISCAQDIPTMTVQDLKTQMKKDTNLVILDVRTPQELVGPLGKINGVINIPVQELKERVHELDKYKNKDFAVICRTGHRSSIGTKILIKNGFDATNVEGGMSAYRESEKEDKK